MLHKIKVDDLVLQVEITDLTDIKPDYTSWDSPDDYNGCKELEFSVVSGERYDEDGNASDLGRNGCAAAAEMYAEQIEARLWEIIELNKEHDELAPEWAA